MLHDFWMIFDCLPCLACDSQKEDEIGINMEDIGDFIKIIFDLLNWLILKSYIFPLLLRTHDHFSESVSIWILLCKDTGFDPRTL